MPSIWSGMSFSFGYVLSVERRISTRNTRVHSARQAATPVRAGYGCKNAELCHYVQRPTYRAGPTIGRTDASSWLGACHADVGRAAENPTQDVDRTGKNDARRA